MKSHSILSLVFNASLFISTLAFFCVMDSACATELVLREGTNLTAKTSLGNISILAGHGLDRTYKWDNCSLKADMGARRSRWYGSLGIYDPAPSFGILSSIFPWWFSCNGISRTVVEEGQIHFADRRAAEHWIENYSKIQTAVWSTDGLLVQWGLDPGREQLNVSVWQICISGQRPIELLGAKNDAFEIVPNDHSISDRYECALVDNDVILETQQVWQKWWIEVEECDKRHKRK
ncbi:MAG: hypothetical protein K4571_20755 [Deltaproteobacteria bacterium]